ncbi:MAG TPA: PIN domain-containing protein [Desulfatiglandales bacterium]|nr:PIN domain-containing protein [Desulfatiglandales bacterium]
MPGDKVFLDTNIILYAYDVSAGEKHQRAKEIILDLWNSGLAVISTQVLQEFFVTATQKIPKPLDNRFAKDIVGDLLKWEVVINDGVSVLEAIELLLQYGYSFWDSLIIEAAIKGGAEILLSEDLSHGQTIQGVTIMNPFKTSPS